MWSDVAVLLILGFVLSWFIPAICHPWNNPPPVPSFSQHRSAVVDLIRGLRRSQPRIAELGAGWGGLTRRLSLLGPVTAIEKSHTLSWWLRCLFCRTKVKILRCDATSPVAQEVCQQSDVVVMYLSPGLNAAISGFLTQGTYVISICFRCPNLTLLEEKSTGSGSVFLYRV
jgi:hypothetical protein